MGRGGGPVPERLCSRLEEQKEQEQGTEVWSEASRRWAPRSRGQEGEEIDVNILAKFDSLLVIYTFDTCALSLDIIGSHFFREAKPTLHHHAERSWRVCRHVHPQEVQCLQQDLVCEGPRLNPDQPCLRGRVHWPHDRRLHHLRHLRRHPQDGGERRLHQQAGQKGWHH